MISVKPSSRPGGPIIGSLSFSSATSPRRSGKLQSGKRRGKLFACSPVDRRKEIGIESDMQVIDFEAKSAAPSTARTAFGAQFRQRQATRKSATSEFQRSIDSSPRFARGHHLPRRRSRPVPICSSVLVCPIEDLLDGQVWQIHAVSDAAVLGKQFGQRCTAEKATSAR
jgi:hypothetical protein